MQKIYIDKVTQEVKYTFSTNDPVIAKLPQFHDADDSVIQLEVPDNAAKGDHKKFIQNAIAQGKIKFDKGV